MNAMLCEREMVELADGNHIVIRPVEPRDVPRLIAMHQRLSEHSRFLRYLGLARALSTDEAREMCEIDYQYHMALVASPCEAPDEVIALAFYWVDDDSSPDAAEIAVLVEDHWQGHGIGTLLLEHLTGY